MRVSRWEPTQSLAGLVYMGRNPFRRGESHYGHDAAGVQHPRVGFSRRSVHRRIGDSRLPEIPDGAAQNASRPRTTLSSEASDRDAVRRKLRERSVSHAMEWRYESRR